MAVFRNIVFRKLTACVLLALMLVIHGVKLFHSHPDYSLRKPVLDSIAGVFVAGGNLSQHCAVCDFQLTRDADITVPHQDSPSIQIKSDFYCCYDTFWHHAYTSLIWLRGPPPVLV